MKKTSVAEVSALSTMKALVLPERTPLTEAIDRFASNEGQHGIFLTGDDGRLSGVVNNEDLLDWARLQFDVMPGDPLPVGKVRRLISATTIADLAGRNSARMSVRVNETISDALVRMASFELEDIAVLDNEGRVVNDLRLSEVLSFALAIQRRQASKS
jgi:CBS-domain-containing membrane protein